MTSFIEEYDAVREFDAEAEITAMRQERERAEMAQRNAKMTREIAQFEAEYGPLECSGDLEERYSLMCREFIAITKLINAQEDAKEAQNKKVVEPVYTKPRPKPKYDPVEPGTLTGYKGHVGSKKQLKEQRAIEAELIGNFAGQNDSEGYVSKKSDPKLFREERKILANSKEVKEVPRVPVSSTPVPERKMNIQVVREVEPILTPPPLVRQESPWETVSRPVRKSPEQPRQERPTRLCKTVFDKVVCKYGSNCRFAHSVQDLEPVYCKFDHCRYTRRIRPGFYANCSGTCDRWHEGECAESYSIRMGLTQAPPRVSAPAPAPPRVSAPSKAPWAR